MRMRRNARVEGFLRFLHPTIGERESEMRARAGWMFSGFAEIYVIQEVKFV